MTTEADLKRLIDLSIVDASYEPAFLRALLTATLYVLLPLISVSSKMQLVCFTRPDGLTVIPAFSDRKKAAAAARGAARIGSLRGSDLFASAPGATYMLDPNDTSTTIYPEEVAALLYDGSAAIAPKFISGPAVRVSPALTEDRWLAELIVEALKVLAGVEAVHLVQAWYGDFEERTSLLAVVEVPAALSERVARALALALEGCGRTLRLPVEMTSYEPSDAPAWAVREGLEPVWTRSSKSMH